MVLEENGIDPALRPSAEPVDAVTDIPVPRAIDLYVGRRVRIARLRKQMTIGDVARDLKITGAAFEAYELGVQRFPPMLLLQLTSLLEVRLAFFFQDS